jgi:hypothetical protein
MRSALITGAILTGMHLGSVPQLAREASWGHRLATHVLAPGILFFDPSVLSVDVIVAASRIAAVARHDVVWPHDDSFSFGVASALLINPGANLAPHELVPLAWFDYLYDGASDATAETVDERQGRRSIVAMHEVSGHNGDLRLD